MDLDKKWSWKTKKLGVRIRPENGNPAADALREAFSELAGVDLKELLTEMKTTKKKKESENKTFVDHEADKTFNEVLMRSRILGASDLAIKDMKKTDELNSTTVTQKNVRKVFTVLPTSPPARVLLEIQRERSKPLRVPDPEERAAATSKLEKKLARQRAVRMAAIEQSAKDEEAIKGFETMNATSTMGHVFPKYNGDLFSTQEFENMEGMLYLSRMARKKTRLRAGDMDGDEQGKDKTASDEDGQNKNEMDDGNGSVNGSSVNSDANAKLNCALSLCNWSRNPANASRLASEGAVRAIMQLSLETSMKIIMYCSSAFRFMSEQVELASAMIDEGAITTISDLIGSTTDDFIIHNLAIAMVNLTRVNGREGQVVEAGIVLALMNTVMQKPDLGPTCVRGMYNLTCVDASYQFIERVIRTLVSFSLSGSGNVKHLCAAALCNLSDLKAVRPRMVEEGAINVLSALSRGAETRTRRVCAVILQNLSAAKSVRVEMASRNSVAAAYSLSSDQDPIILRCIGLTISRLAMEPANCQRIIHESGIVALCNIAVKYPTIPGITQPVASGFQLLSSHQPYRVNVVNEGCVTAIASLLRSSVDMFTLQHSLLALSNLLCEPDNHLTIIQQGLLPTLTMMCSQENEMIKDFCSLAFLNLSCSEDSRKHLINGGAIGAIIAVTKTNSEATKRRCAATLCNLSYYATGMNKMVQDGIIPSIVSLVLATDIQTVHYACAALCRLCCTVDNAKLILDSGAVPNLVKGAQVGDDDTKIFCGAVLSALSFYESCRVTLCDMGAINALKGLSEINDEVTKQRVLVAFANLSCDVSVQAKMIDDGVVGIIANLANSYQEINYICCAKAICNLACCAEKRLAVAAEGGVVALFMISMVQSVDRLTKLLCVLGLNNLLDHTTIGFMLKEGIIGSVANLSKIGDNHISNLCAKIFNHLTKYPEARLKMAEKSAALNAVHKLADSSTVETQIIATRTACNLVLDPEVRNAAVKCGVCFVLEKGAGLSHRVTSMQCLLAIFSLCGASNGSHMSAVAATPFAVNSVQKLSQRPLKNDPVAQKEYSYIARSLAMLSWCEESRPLLQTKSFMEAFIYLINVNLHAESVEWLASCLRHLIIAYPNLDEVVDMNIIGCLVEIHHASNDEQVVKYLVEAIRSLGEHEVYLPALAGNAGVFAILRDGAHFSSVMPCANKDQKQVQSQYCYDICAMLYLFASSSAGTRAECTNCVNDVLAILPLLAAGGVAKCIELITLTIGLILTDQKNRAPFLVQEMAQVLMKCNEYHKQMNDNTTSNLVLAIHAFAKQGKCREFLLQMGVDKVLSRLSAVENAKIRANATRALKNLNADVNEAIEEGMVSALIAMSLEGRLKNQSSDEFIHPALEGAKNKNLPPPACSSQVSDDVEGSNWYENVIVTKGGAAGKGPEPPEPHAISVDGCSEYPNMTDEAEATEIEGKTKMAFAKMQVPQNLKEAFLLTDSDFIVRTDEDQVGTGEEASEVTQEEVGFGPANGSEEYKNESFTSASVTLPNNMEISSPNGEERSGSSKKGNRRGSSKAPGSASNKGSVKIGEDMAATHPSPKKKSAKKAAAKQHEEDSENNMGEQAARLGLYA